jgi:hypothetical protein
VRLYFTSLYTGLDSAPVPAFIPSMVNYSTAELPPMFPLTAATRYKDYTKSKPIDKESVKLKWRSLPRRRNP